LGLSLCVVPSYGFSLLRYFIRRSHSVRDFYCAFLQFSTPRQQPLISLYSLFFFAPPLDLSYASGKRFPIQWSTSCFFPLKGALLIRWWPTPSPLLSISADFLPRPLHGPPSRPLVSLLTITFIKFFFNFCLSFRCPPTPFNFCLIPFQQILSVSLPVRNCTSKAIYLLLSDFFAPGLATLPRLTSGFGHHSLLFPKTDAYSPPRCVPVPSTTPPHEIGSLAIDILPPVGRILSF